LLALFGISLALFWRQIKHEGKQMKKSMILFVALIIFAAFVYQALGLTKKSLTWFEILAI